jgi:type IV pilus assembly protein PilW
MIRPPRPPYAQRGLTLIELMIALGLGLLLVAALGYLYAGQRQSWRTLEAVARLQENGRLAMELVGRDLRQAGYAGCLSLPEARFVLQAKLANTTEQSAFSNLIDPFLTGGRLVTGYAGWGVDRNLDGTVNSTDRPNNYLVGTDTLFLVGGQDPVAYTSAAMTSVSAAIPITANSLRFSQGELVLISDCRGGDVFRISGAGNDEATFTNPLPHDATRNGTAALSRAYAANASVMPFTLHVYYLRRPNPTRLPSLYRLPWARAGGWDASEELVEGVEAMRLTYGVDNNNDGTVDSYNTAPNVTDWSRVRAVRVSLLLVSAEDGVAAAPQTYVWDTDNDGELDDTVTAPDRRLRFVFTSTFALRNRP